MTGGLGLEEAAGLSARDRMHQERQVEGQADGAGGKQLPGDDGERHLSDGQAAGVGVVEAQVVTVALSYMRGDAVDDRRASRGRQPDPRRQRRRG